MRSAGNLLATTRYDQPGAFAAESGPRPTRISGGVLLSLPGQNTQSPPRGTTPSVLKSDGRRARSVEMMTQRPTTGSFRRSGTMSPHLDVLTRRGAPQQRGQRVRRRLAVEEHGRDLRR